MKSAHIGHHDEHLREKKSIFRVQNALQQGMNWGKANFWFKEIVFILNSAFQ